jgi:hypothetical protein
LPAQAVWRRAARVSGVRATLPRLGDVLQQNYEKMLETKSGGRTRGRLIAAIAGSRELAPGLVIAALVALAASWLSEHYRAPVMLFALLLGIALNFLSGMSVAGPASTSLHARYCA